MAFEEAKAKLTIKSLDGGPTVEAQYNPKELQVDKSIPWSKKNQANQSNERGIHLEFTGAEGRSMTVELLFDGVEKDGGSHTKTFDFVEEKVSDLEELASVIDASSPDENLRRPHRCLVVWGDGGMPSFRCVIESLSTKYTMI